MAKSNFEVADVVILKSGGFKFFNLQHRLFMN